MVHTSSGNIEDLITTLSGIFYSRSQYLELTAEMLDLLEIAKAEIDTGHLGNSAEPIITDLALLFLNALSVDKNPEFDGMRKLTFRCPDCHEERDLCNNCWDDYLRCGQCREKLHEDLDKQKKVMH